MESNKNRCLIIIVLQCSKVLLFTAFLIPFVVFNSCFCYQNLKNSRNLKFHTITAGRTIRVFPLKHRSFHEDHKCSGAVIGPPALCHLLALSLAVSQFLIVADLNPRPLITNDACLQQAALMANTVEDKFISPPAKMLFILKILSKCNLTDI